MISLALAIVAIAVTATSISALNLARRDFQADRIVYALAGAHERADLTMLAAGLSNRLRWNLTLPEGPVSILAEAEGPKMALSAAAGLDDASVAKLDITDANALRLRLKSMTHDEAIGSRLEAVDASHVWRACARSLISAYGDAKTIPVLKATAPVADTSAWHAGDVWRIRVALGGWVDDRTVRFSGGPVHPAQTIERRFYRQTQGDDRCDALFAR